MKEKASQLLNGAEARYLQTNNVFENRNTVINSEKSCLGTLAPAGLFCLVYDYQLTESALRDVPDAPYSAKFREISFDLSSEECTK